LGKDVRVTTDISILSWRLHTSLSYALSDIVYINTDYIFKKLEIVGDGYVVVSGLPKENGLDHGTEICKMSLELMYQVQ